MRRRVTLVLLVFAGLNFVAALPSFPGPQCNDQILHIHQIKQMEEAFSTGQPLIDHWDPTLETGYPFLRNYPHLSHLIVWSWAHFLGIEPTSCYNALILILWAIWPVSVFFGLRKLDVAWSSALVSAAFSSVLHSTFRFGISFETFFNFGLGPYLLSLCLFPISLGFGLRFCQRNEHSLLSIMLFVMTWYSHLVMGFILSLSLFVLVIFSPRHNHSPIRFNLFRLATLFFFGMASCLFFIFPFLFESQVINKTALEPTYYWTSHPMGDVLANLVHGNVFEAGFRFPFFLILLLISCLLLLKNRSLPRWPLILGFFWFLLYANSTLNTVIRIALPFASKVPFERFILPFQFCALTIVGLGIGEVLSLTRKRTYWFFTSLIVLGVFPLAIGYLNNFNISKMNQIQNQKSNKILFDHNLNEFVQLEKTNQNGSRVYLTGTKKGMGLYLNSKLTLNGIPNIGFLWHTMSQNSDFLYDVHPDQIEKLNLFNIDKTVLPSKFIPQPGFQALVQTKDFSIFECQTKSSLFTSGKIGQNYRGQPQEFRQEVKSWLRSPKPGQGIFCGFNLPQDSAINNCEPTELHLQGPEIIKDANFGYKIHTYTDKKTILIGKFTWHPRWKAFLDGEETSTFQVSPSFTAIILPKGDHSIEFKFDPGTQRRWFLILSLLSIFLFYYVSKRLEQGSYAKTNS